MKLRTPSSRLLLCAIIFASALVTRDAFGKPPASTIKTQRYHWENVKILGGGFVTGVVFNQKERDLIYARTDVGGAYRWDAANHRWLALNDALGSEDSELLGVLSLATDPVDPNRLYLACGQYLPDWAQFGAILRSTDRGKTWTRTPLPVRLGGNSDGRSTGERLQVDPHQNSVLFLGTNQNGLFVSTDFAATWRPVKNFPAQSVTFVLFDHQIRKPGAPAPILYVGADNPNGPALFRSIDGGTTWAPLADQPVKGLIPHHAELDANGTIYFVYGNRPGPNDITDGAVWKFNPGDNTWTDISPLKPNQKTGDVFGYGALSVDRRHPGTLMVSTLDRWNKGDEIFRSSDHGATWKPILARSSFDASSAPYVAQISRHWIGDLDIDPFNPNRVFFTTGYGLWSTETMTAADETNGTLTWSFAVNEGLEETVPFALVSPPIGPPLLSALSDIGGFRHDDLSVSPTAGTHQPMHGSNTSVAFAELLPTKLVRTHSGPARGGLSLDSGATWTDFLSTPRAAKDKGPGTITISADGKRLLWWPKGSTAFWSDNDGKTWTPCKGSPTSENDHTTDTPVADRVDPKVFYLYRQKTGRVYVSLNGGISFKASRGGPPAGGNAAQAVPGYAGHVWQPTPQGLYRSTNFGKTYRALPAVQEAWQVGFGQAAAGKNHPVIYLAGKIQGITGVFRSDDEGQNWVMISDALHRFGTITCITGDPRIYGRVYLGTGGRGIIYGDFGED